MPSKNRAQILQPRAGFFEFLPGTFLILSIFALSFTGIQVADAPGNGNDDMPANDPKKNPGKYGQQINFNGVTPHGILARLNNPHTQLLTVTITAPTAGIVAGNINVTADASDDIGVEGVQFLVDGENLDAEDIAAPYSVSWNTFSVNNGTYTLTAMARDAAGNTSTSAGIIVTVNNDTQIPTVSITGPAAGNVSGAISITADAGDDFGVAGVQFLLNGVNFDAEDIVAPYSVSWNTLTETNGTYTLTAIARDATGNTSTSSEVIVTVNNDTQIPTVSITEPAAGNVSGTISITADAGDDFAVAGVQFLLNGVNLGAEDIVTPYSVSWNTLTETNGAYTLTAIARDAAGNTSTSTGVIVTVNNDTQIPTVSITTPAAGNVSGTINVTANASDNVGVVGVQFLLNGVNSGAEDIAAPYSVSWNTLTAPNGTYTLTAMARDAAGNTSTSPGIIVTVNNDTQIPTVSLTTPAAGNVSGTINVTANASDNIGVVGVQFLLNGVNLGAEDIAASYSVSWNTLTAPNGTYTLTAIARDAAGNTSTSAGVIVTVNNNTQIPTVSITAPAAGDVSGTINVTANASDDVGVVGVQFMLNGVNLAAEDIAAPYSVSWNTLTAANGTYTLTAKARDAAGNFGNASPVIVTVLNTNLVAAFGFNETTGTIAYDNSGSGNNGTLTNGPAWSASGKYGRAILFDGTNDLVNINDANSLDLTNGMTLEAWVNPSNLTGYKTVLCKENGSNNLAYALSANNNTSNVANQRPNTRIRIGSTTPTSTGTVKLALNTWTHIASTYDGATLRFFINGIQVSSVAVTGNIVTANKMLRIGGSPNLGTQYFAGLIDEVKIYNRALSQAEIQTDMTIPVWPDNTNPTVTITAPPAGNVSGAINVTANASDNIAVAGVQFMLNGVNLGAEDIAGPYSVSWNTLAATNGTYTLTARARDAAGNFGNASPVTVTVLNISLVAAFGFNENTGTIAFDNSGNCNNGTLTNGPTWSASGKYGAAILFDGTNDLVNIIDANSLDLTNGMTLEAWVKPSNLTGYKTVLCKENGTNNLAYALSANNNTSNVASQRPDTRIRIGSATKTSTGTAKLALNTWTHIASTYDGATLRLFINGIQVSSVAATGNMVTTTNMLRIGGSPNLGTQYFAGLIDEVRIYNRALSQAEIQTDMIIPVPPAVTTSPENAGTLTAVSTFESIGLYWSGTSCFGGGSNVVCNVQYRVAGSNSPWSVGYPLSFDSRQHNANDVSGAAAGYNKAWLYTGVTRPSNEYRGSIVGLTAGTNYEIKVSLQGISVTNAITQATWSETSAWHVASTVAVPDGSTGFNITSGGTAGNYIKYQPANGVSGTINVNNGSPNCIYINAPYVIISKLTLMGAAEDAIRLGPNAHDILIDSCDISGWGQVSMGTNSQAGVRIGGFADNCYGVVRVVIQRCKIHESRANSNSWDNGGHPVGPNGINFEEAGGNHVIRYNEIYGNDNHYFMDGIGGGDNFTKSGFTRSDMDIYGNRITMVYDDAIEAEGANMNCRIWNNFLDNTFTGIANATNSVGPMYIFRNITHVSQRSQNGSAIAIIDAEDRGPLNKCGGNNNSTVTGGMTYLFHNTILEPIQTGFTYPRGMGGGPIDNGGAVKNVVSRNNIWQTHRPTASGWPSIGEWQSAANSGNSYDYDLYNGILFITATGGVGSHLINGTPSYVGGTPVAPISINSGPRIEGYYLQPGTAGHDAGTLLPNFNDNYLGAAPDVGAYENGDLLIITGAKVHPSEINVNDTSMSSIKGISIPTSVTLTEFNSGLVNCQPVLSWITETEINIDRFEIEKSNPDNAGWTLIGSVAANGHISKRTEYNFIDRTSNNSSAKIFYRLKMIDKGGTYKYSEVVGVFSNCRTAQVHVYPNPVQHGKLYISITGASGYTEAILLSLSGQVILKSIMHNGTNSLNTSTIADGVYLLNIKDANGIDKKVKVMVNN